MIYLHFLLEFIVPNAILEGGCLWSTLCCLWSTYVAYDLPGGRLWSTYFLHSAEISVLGKIEVDHKQHRSQGQKAGQVEVHDLPRGSPWSTRFKSMIYHVEVHDLPFS